MDSLFTSYIKVLERALDTLSAEIDIESLTKPQVVNCLGYLDRLEPQTSLVIDWPKYLIIRARLERRLIQVDSPENQ